MKNIVESILDPGFADKVTDHTGKVLLLKSIEKTVKGQHYYTTGRRGHDVACRKIRPGDYAWFVDYTTNNTHPCIIVNPDTGGEDASIEILLGFDFMSTDIKSYIKDGIYGLSESGNLVVNIFNIIKTNSFK